MFGLFKKKQGSKSISKARPLEKQGQIKLCKQSKTNGKVVKSSKQSKQSQKATCFQREQTQGEFVQKRRAKKPQSTKKLQKQQNSNNQTPKIQNKKNLKQIQEKATERPYNMDSQKQDNTSQKQKCIHGQNQIQRFDNREDLIEYEDAKLKQIINLKSICKLLIQLKSLTQQENQLIISRQLKNNKALKQTHDKLFHSKYFRFIIVKNITQLIQRYGQIIQSMQILISKLDNRIGKGVHFHKDYIQNQQRLQKIYIADQSEFLLFFKHFFSKPYTLCNRFSTRKVIQILWESVSFKQNSPKKLYQQIKLWVYGISIPSNPILIMLHKIVIKNAQLIPKYAKMIYNDKIYMGVNDTDPLVKTPLKLAAELGNKKALQKLIKCGADPHLSPYYHKKSQYSFQYSQTKYKKHIFTLNFPQFSRKILTPLQHILYLRQEMDLLADCMYFMQLSNIRNMRKQAGQINQKLTQIPDCTFQISWKTYRGLINFKQLPSDIITVYKKGTMLRVDYNIDSIQNPVKGKHFTLLLKAGGDRQLQFYQIKHHNKVIVNRMTEIDMGLVKQRLNQFIKYPHSRNCEITQCKGMYSMAQHQQGRKINISLNLNMQNQVVAPQIKKNFDYKKAIFKNVAEYQNSIIQSQVVDYKAISTSEINAVMQENIINQKHLPVKIKSKTQKSVIGLQIQFQQQIINLRHFEFIMQFFKNDSALINKLLKILRVFENEDVFGSNVNLFDYLPSLSKISLQKDLTLQIQIKNINYIKINDNVFDVQYKVVKDMNFQQNTNQRIMDSMQQTMLMEEGYSINVSQFLGKDQRLLQKEDEYARDKFQRMLLGEGAKQLVQYDNCRNSNILDELEDDD